MNLNRITQNIENMKAEREMMAARFAAADPVDPCHHTSSIVLGNYDVQIARAEADLKQLQDAQV